MEYKAPTDIETEGLALEEMSDVKELTGDKPEEETDSESLPETKTEEEEGSLPFHEDPKVQAYLDRQLEKREDKLRGEFSQEIDDIKKDTTEKSEKVPDWFVELYGDNQVAWDKYSEHSKNERESIKADILHEQQESVQKDKAEAEKWEKWVETEVQGLKDEGNTFDENKLKKIMLDYSPTNSDNNLDFKKGMEIYKALEAKPDTEKSEARKELADKTTSTTTKGDSAKKDYMSSNELRNRTMSNL